VGQHMAHLDTALAAGDELTILDFLHRDIGSFQIPVDSFRKPLAVIGWQAQL